MRDMSLKDTPQRITWARAGSLVLPLVYLVALVRSRDPDLIVSLLGPMGTVVRAVQRTALALGGRILACAAVTLYCSVVGYAVGALAGWIADAVAKLVDRR